MICGDNTEIHAKELREWCRKLKDPHEKSINVSIKMLVASDNIQILRYRELTLCHVPLLDSKRVEVALELYVYHSTISEVNKLYCIFSCVYVSPKPSTNACCKMQISSTTVLIRNKNITYMTIWFARSKTLASSGHSTLSRAPCCRFIESLLARVDSWTPVAKLIIGDILSHTGEGGASLIMENSLSFRCWGLDVLVLRNCGHDNRLWLLLGSGCNPTWDSLLFIFRCFW